jgi:predicted phosphodiesterase
MQIVCISDTHGMYDRITVPDGDVLIHAGDATAHGSINDIIRLNTWLQAQPHKHKILISGNHDWMFQKRPEPARKLITAATYLQDSETTIDGLRFYGSPWQPEFCNWAFNLPRQGPELKAKWAAIPDGIDVLITHGPPFGYLDKVQPSPLSLGCELLRKAVARVKPKLHVFGHIHDGYGIQTTSLTTFVNASICTERYRPTNAPIVINI